MQFSFDTLEESYDVVVCGAGPAGLNAVRHLQQQSKHPLKIALLDKRDPWREPVACAEAVHRGGLYSLTEVNDNWIRSTIDGAYMVSPDGTKVLYTRPGSGLILDRALMHYDLAVRAQESGAHCHFRTRVLKIHSLENNSRKIDVEIEGNTHILTSRYVIDASGAGPSLTRSNESDQILKDHFDVEPAVFGLVKGIPCETNHIEMYFGQNYAPGGYAWVFPRDGETTNVGIVVGREFLKTHPPRKMYAEFLKRFGDKVESGPLHGGPIACGQPLEPIADQCLFKTGDAADMVNPISRAGILEAMYGGKITAEAIIELMNTSSSEHQSIYSRYLERWMKHKGEGHLRLARGKKIFNQISDKTFDRAAHKLVRIPPEKRTKYRILWATFTAQPLLLWKMRSLF